MSGLVIGLSIGMAFAGAAVGAAIRSGPREIDWLSSGVDDGGYGVYHPQFRERKGPNLTSMMVGAVIGAVVGAGLGNRIESKHEAWIERTNSETATRCVTQAKGGQNVILEQGEGGKFVCRIITPAPPSIN